MIIKVFLDSTYKSYFLKNIKDVFGFSVKNVNPEWHTLQDYLIITALFSHLMGQIEIKQTVASTKILKRSAIFMT